MSTVDCAACQRDLMDHQRGGLPPERAGALAAHLATCPACAHEDRAERALTDVLERQLPQYPASLALKRRLAREWGPRPTSRLPRPARVRAWSQSLRAGAAVAAVLLLLATASVLAWRHVTSRGEALAERLVAEAVNDHLRVAGRPLEVAGPSLHEVRPWFTGRLDFAPVVPFGGDQEFPLRGGGVEYFIDRPAAVIVYARRLHTISLIVVRAEGLPFPAGPAAGPGAPPGVLTATERGFSVALWRNRDLGYLLVSDVSVGELLALASRLVPAREIAPPPSHDSR